MKLLIIFLLSMFSTFLAHAGDVTYEIQKGDQLMFISKKIYGTYHKWHKIVEANPSIHPNFLPIGRKILIPNVTTETIAREETAVPVIDEFTEESVLTILDLKRRPSGSLIKKIFDKDSATDDRPVDGIQLENEHPKTDAKDDEFSGFNGYKKHHPIKAPSEPRQISYFSITER